MTSEKNHLVILAIVALTVLLLVARAEAMWRRRSRRARGYKHRPTAGTERVTAVIHPGRRQPAGRQVSWAPGLASAQRLPSRPEAGVARGIIKIVVVYRTEPVMVVGETADGALLEHSLPELAHMPERLPPRLWQKLVEQYQVFQIR
jgi:hypothetical protein